jgi:hypothetical protein
MERGRIRERFSRFYAAHLADIVVVANHGNKSVIAQHAVEFLALPVRGLAAVGVRLAPQTQIALAALLLLLLLSLLDPGPALAREHQVRVERLPEHVGVVDVPALVHGDLQVDDREELHARDELASLPQVVQQVPGWLQNFGGRRRVLEQVQRGARHEVVATDIVVPHVHFDAVEHALLVAPEREDFPVEVHVEAPVVVRLGPQAGLLAAALDRADDVPARAREG